MKTTAVQRSADGRVEFDGDGVPVAFNVFNAGPNKLSKNGREYSLDLTAADLETIAKNFRAKGNDIPVDAKHLFGAIGDALSVDEDKLVRENSVLFSELCNGMLGVERRGASLWMTVTKWADAVRNIFASRRSLIPFFSPVIRGVKLNEEKGALEIPDRTRLRITSLTLCGSDQPPALHNAPMLAASENSADKDFAFAVVTMTEPAISKKNNTGETMKKVLERLGALLGLSGDSLKLSDTEIGGTTETLCSKAADRIEAMGGEVKNFIRDVSASLKLTGENTLDTVKAAIGQLATTAGGASLQLTEVTSRLRVLEGNEHARLVKSLMTEGKLTAAMEPWAMGQSSVALTEWAKNAPVIVQNGQQGGGALPVETSDGVMMTEQDFANAQNGFGKTLKEKLENYAKANRMKVPAAMLQRAAAFVCLLALVFATILSAPTAKAAAASGPINTQVRDGVYLAPLASSNVFYAGTIAAVNSSGVAVPAADASGYKVIGIFDQSYDNSGSTYSATKTIRVRRGVFQLSSGSTNTAADIGNMAYVIDNQTVGNASEATYDIMAGIIVDVDATGTNVWVDTLSVGRQGAASFTAITASGNASIAGTLNATGGVALASTLSVGGVATLSGTNTVFGSSMVGGSITQQTVSAYLKVQGPGGTNYYIKAFAPTGP